MLQVETVSIQADLNALFEEGIQHEEQYQTLHAVYFLERFPPT